MITEEEIELNLERIENGEALTIPLSVLNGKFKKVYRKKYGDSMSMLVRTPKRNQKKNRLIREKVYKKAYQKAYHQKPEVKAHKKAYYQKPEVKAHIKAYQKAYHQKNKLRIKNGK